jgi:hypothetical protein
MMSSAERADLLERAIRAGVARDVDALGELVTDDVRVWTPRIASGSMAELLTALAEPDEAFRVVDLDVRALDVAGDFACVEWTAGLTHTGPITRADHTVVEPTGTRVIVHGVTVAEFAGARICALRQYADELAPLAQLGLVDHPV